MTYADDTFTELSANTVSHWTCFALAWAEERGHTPIHPSELAEQMGAVFNKNTVNTAVNQLISDGSLYRTPRRGRRLVSLSEAGKRALLDAGIPSSLPQKSTQELDHDFSLPDAAHNICDESPPEKLYIETDESPTHLFSIEETTGELQPLCGATASAEHRRVASPQGIRHRDVCEYCTERRDFELWEDNTDPVTASETVPELFINDASLSFVSGDMRHLWTLDENSRGGSHSMYEPLCDSVDSIRQRRVSRSFTSAPTLDELAADDVCTACQQHERVDEYRAIVKNYQESTESTTPSQWERYQDWVDEHEFDDNTFEPDQLLEEGMVLVSIPYTARGASQRKLHAYCRLHSDGSDSTNLFTTVCGTRGATTEHEDNLDAMEPSSFLRRSDACKRCSTIVETQDGVETPRRQNAKTVNYDPFGVFGDGDSDFLTPTTDESTEPAEPTEAAEPEVPEDSGEDAIRCSDCGREFDTSKGLTLHWGHPRTDCEYPFPTEDERAILTGLWLAGGDADGSSTPLLRKTSVNREALEFINGQLGIWSGSVDVGQTEDDQRANVEAGFGYKNSESRTQYRLTTRTCPWLDELAELSIEDVELQPDAARILYSFRGHLIDKSTISIRHRNGPGLATLLEDAGFGVRNVTEPSEGKHQYRVTLAASAAREFAEWVGDPLPGFENKAFEFRESHVHKEGQRVSAETDQESQAMDVPDTISLEPEWDWVGVQLFKLGLRPLAVRAFREELTPAEVYAPGGVQDIIYSAATEGTGEYNLDVGPPFPEALTLHEQPVEPETVDQVKRELGLLDTNSNNGGENGNNATA